MYESLFILSAAYLLRNAASYDGEIFLHADAYRPCAKHLLRFVSIGGHRYQKMTFFKNGLHVDLRFCSDDGSVG